MRKAWAWICGGIVKLGDSKNSMKSELEIAPVMREAKIGIVGAADEKQMM